MNKIHIAFVVTNCKKTGPIQQTYNIIQHMDREIFEPSLITVWNEQADNTLIDQYKSLGIPVYLCGLDKKKSVFWGQSAVGSALDRIKPDIVQGVGMPPYRMTLGYKSAVHFATLRNYCYEDYPDYYGKVLGTAMAFFDIRLIKKQIIKGEPFVTCSESLSNLYRTQQNITIPFIRNGVDVSKYTKRKLEQVPTMRQKLNLPLDKIIFVYSGILIDRKNQREAINAFLEMKKKKSVALLLLGNGKDDEMLKTEYGKDSEVLFRGKVSNVNEYLHASDVYLSSSKSEGLPNGVLEAMACGLPVLLSNIPQHMEVLEPEPTCGHSYTLGNVKQLSDFMDQMVNENLNEMGEKSYKAVMENFTSENMSKHYQHLYQSVLERNNKVQSIVELE